MAFRSHFARRMRQSYSIFTHAACSGARLAGLCRRRGLAGPLIPDHFFLGGIVVANSPPPEGRTVIRTKAICSHDACLDVVSSWVARHANLPKGSLYLRSFLARHPLEAKCTMALCTLGAPARTRAARTRFLQVRPPRLFRKGVATQPITITISSSPLVHVDRRVDPISARVIGLI